MVTLFVSDSSSDQPVPEDDPGGSGHRTDGLLSEGYREECLFAPLQRLLATFSSKRVSGCLYLIVLPPLALLLSSLPAAAAVSDMSEGAKVEFFP